MKPFTLTDLLDGNQHKTREGRRVSQPKALPNNEVAVNIEGFKFPVTYDDSGMFLGKEKNIPHPFDLIPV